MAVEDGRSSVVEALVAAKANLNVKNDDGNTPLYVAAGKDDCACTRILVEGKAHVDFRDDRGNSALYYAAQRGNTEVLRVLVGPNVGFMDSFHASMQLL